MFHSSLLLLIFGQLSAQNLRPRAGRAALAGRACPKICFFLVYCGSKYLENGLALSAAKNWKEKRVFLFRFSKTLVCMLTLLLSLGSGMALGRLMTSASGRWRGWGLTSSSGQRFPKPSWGRQRPRPRQLRPPLHRELRRSERIICFFRAVYFAGAPNFFFLCTELLQVSATTEKSNQRHASSIQGGCQTSSVAEQGWIGTGDSATDPSPFPFSSSPPPLSLTLTGPYVAKPLQCVLKQKLRCDTLTLW